MIVFLALATSNFSWPCECEAMQPAEETAAEGHGCCPGSQAAAEEAPPEVLLQQACAPGCCDGEEVALTALVDKRSGGIEAPALVPAPSFAGAAVAAVAPRTSFVPGAADIRGPPPPMAKRLARLQLWRC